jgi:purine-nucleoside phosphorylase
MNENSELIDQIEECVTFLRKRIDKCPNLAIILGTGMGNLPDDVEIIREIPFKLIPYMMPTTVESHSGKLIWVSWANREVLIVSGRLHYYEGYSTHDITFLVRVLKFLGVKSLWITNASGTVNPIYNAGDIVFLEDHINFHPENPLRGIRDERLGLRFPDMSDVYNKELLRLASKVCDENNIPFHTGIYFGLQGPSLETPAEYRMIRLLGADVVGMSTVPEVIVAHQSELKIMAVTIVSNSSPQLGQIQKTTMEDVIATIQSSSQRLFTVLGGMIREF